MTDQELLEAAAKAMGEKVPPRFCPDGSAVFLSGQKWSPLTDDGDALRLAVTLRISLDMLTHIVDATTGTVMCHEPWGDDHCAATRRAIVRAAAAMAVGAA